MKNQRLPILIACAVGWTVAFNTSVQASGSKDPRSPAPISSVQSPPALSQAVNAVFKDYFAIQTALARDSMHRVSANAQALVKAARRGDIKSFPATLADPANTLAKSKRLAQARRAFKAMSRSLIAYLKSHNGPAATYYEVYCPITKASWLQTGKTIRNPYLGLRSATPTWGWTCDGVLGATFTNPSVGGGSSQ